MEQQQDLLRIEDLQISIGKGEKPLRPVDRVSLEIPRHTVVGLVGESGCGKSMTAMSIMGLLGVNTRISGGRILFEGEEISAATPARMREIVGNSIAMIFQEPMTSLNPVVRVGKQVGEVLKLHTNLNAAQRKERVIEMFKQVSIPEAEERYRAYPFQLSGGLRQRIMIAMAMICNPRLLIADEPTTALDVTIEAQILHLMRQLKQEFDTSILMITHNLGIVSELCDVVNVMYLGEIVEHATTEALFEAPMHPYTQALFSAVPVPDPDVKNKRIILKGDIPSPANPPSGCKFHTRCNKCMEICKTETPVFKEYAPGHRVACHLYEQNNLSGITHE